MIGVCKTKVSSNRYGRRNRQLGVAMPLVVIGEFHLQLSGRGEPQVAEGYEPVDVAQHGMIPAQLVEDELILSTPLAPRHEDDEVCRDEGSTEDERETGGDDTHRPFAALDNLLKRN